MANKNREKSMIIFSDMTRVEPKSAISENLDKYTWQTLMYETEEFSGIMLRAVAESEVPEITLQMGLEGWYQVYLGLWTDGNGWYCGTSVKLSGDEATTYVTADRAKTQPAKFEEVYWKSADLTNKSIIFSHPKWKYPEGSYRVSSYVVYVKCVPLSDEEVLEIKEDRKRKDTKKLICMNDMFGLLYGKRPISMEPLLEDLEPYRNTDFCKIHLEYWGDGGQDAEYSENKGMYGDGILYDRIGDRSFFESKKILKAKGIDYYQKMIDYARSTGLKVYLSQRMNAFVSEAPYDTFFTSSFFKDFPQYRCKDRDGIEIARMSFAYSEVQDNFLETFKKMASYGPDGVSLLFNRAMPFMLYEEPLINGFMKEYGEDPRGLDEEDERWLDYKCRKMTEFVRRLKRTMDECARMQNKDRINISIHGYANGVQNKKYGLDIGSWAREGLIDEVIAYPTGIIGLEKLDNNRIPIDVDYYVNLVKDTGCKIYIDVLPREMEPEEYRLRAIEYYSKGVDGLCFWDTMSRHPKLRQWSIVRRLGHKEELLEMDSGEGKYFREVTIKTLGGIRVDRYPPVWGL